MKKPSYLILLLFIFFSNNILSQKSHFSVKESIKYKDQHKTTNILSIYSTNNNLNVVTRKSKHNLIFETFNNEAVGQKVRSIKLSKKETFVGDIFHNNKLQVFMVESPSKTKRILNCYTYNIDSNSYKKVTLLEKEVKKKSALFSGQNKRQTNFSISPDNKFIAIATDNIKKNSNSYDIHVFDSETLTLNYHKNYFNNKDKYYQSTDMIIDNNGTVYNIGKEFKKGKSERKKSKANYSYIIVKINKKAIQKSIIELNEDEYIKSLSMTFYKDQIRLIGYYSKDKVFGVKGVSNFYINKKSLTLNSKKKQKLPVEVFEDLYGYRNSKNLKNKELSSFYLDHILEDSKGNIYLVAEEFYVTQTYVSYGNGAGGFVTTYHYDDILITKLDTEGNIVWGRSIFKRATEPSYNAYLHNDKLHLLLNSGKNLLKKKNGTLKVSKGWFESSSLYLFLYDEKGVLTNTKVQDNKGNTFYTPYRGSHSDGKFIMYNHSRGRKRVMILSCEE